MARATPRVENARLIDRVDAAQPITVGTPAWFAWLAQASSFTFIDVSGRFTARKERRGPADGYWRAYRKRAGVLHSAYLGKSAALTLERLQDAATALTASTLSEPHPARPRTGPSAGAAESLVRLSAGMPTDTRESGDDPPRAPARLAATRRPGDAAATLDTDPPLHLLLTKLAIPAVCSNLVSRPRLTNQLTTAIHQGHRLILIAAPAGFGKTTVLIDWLGQNEKLKIENEKLERIPVQSYDPGSQFSSINAQFKVAWLSLDDDDNQLDRFLAYLITALEHVRPGVGAAAWPLLHASDMRLPAQAILTTLLNALADSPDRIVFILEDYHAIALQTIHEALAFLLDHMPPHMHIVIVSRADPPLPLARLRLRNQLTELRTADLRFTGVEAAHFFDRIRGLHLPVDAVAALEARTEGWIAGLQLAALSLQKQDPTQHPAFIADFTGSNRYVWDYLADEVFQRQPDHVRTFLMQTAILSRLCGPLCAAVTGQDDAQTLLEHLDQANLFLIRLDSNRYWYRYHYLFRDFLRAHLERAVGTNGRTLLHRRASAWFEEQGLVGEAIGHALSAQAWADALRCLAPLMASERLYDYYLDWPRWLQGLPDAVLQTDPEFCLRFAWILVNTGHVEAAERPFRLAEDVWQDVGNQLELGELLGYRALALVFTGDFAHAMRVAQQALDTLPADAIEQRAYATYFLGISDLSLGHAGSAMSPLIAAHAGLRDSSEVLHSLGAAFGLARAHQLQGQLQRAAALYQDVIRRGGDTTHQQMPLAYIYLGMLSYEWNDLDAAEHLLRKGITVGQQIGRGRYWPDVYSTLAQVRWTCGDAAQAAHLVEQSLAAARLFATVNRIAEVEAYQARFWLVQGDLAAAERWLTMRALNADDTVPYERRTEYLMLARIRITQEQQASGSADLNAVVRLLDRLRQVAEADQRMPDQIAILALMALASMAQHDLPHALETISLALTLAEPERYIRTFVDEGTAMRALLLARRMHLPASAAGERLRVYIDRLLAAFRLDLSAAPAPSTPHALLSERERAVLQLIAGGRSVQEIATLLVISAHTTRTHLKHIYAKLEVHSRLQALERARALNLM